MALTVVDAGVVIALGDTADVHHHGAQIAIRRAHAAGVSLLLPASAFAEVLVAPIRKHGAIDGRHRVERVLDLLSIGVVQLGADIAALAASLRAQHGSRLRLPDALVVATAAHNQASVLTTDARWPKLASVAVTVVGKRRSPRTLRSAGDGDFPR
jgi:predicted nucleic acid-binding protein